MAQSFDEVFEEMSKLAAEENQTRAQITDLGREIWDLAQLTNQKVRERDIARLKVEALEADKLVRLVVSLG
jgi:hypothetical protein